VTSSPPEVVGEVKSSISAIRPTGSTTMLWTSIERSIAIIESRKATSSASVVFDPSGTPTETITRCERKWKGRRATGSPTHR
jgi:hypothetical protein